MIFTRTKFQGAFLISLEPKKDGRGFFARTFCKDEMARHGLETEILQCNLSYNKLKGTLRGMHIQKKPFEEAKYVQCNSGAIFDVMVDLRPESKTYKCWEGFELSEKNRRILYLPKGLAHGFFTLTDDVQVYYQMSVNFNPEAAMGYRWNDPAFGIQWPGKIAHLSRKDLSYPDFKG